MRSTRCHVPVCPCFFFFKVDCPLSVPMSAPPRKLHQHCRSECDIANKHRAQCTEHLRGASSARLRPAERTARLAQRHRAVQCRAGPCPARALSCDTVRCCAMLCRTACFFMYFSYIPSIIQSVIPQVSHPTVGVALSAPKCPWAIEFLM